MHKPTSPQTKEALRELRECAPPTFSRLAALTGIHVTTIRQMAAVENWTKYNFVKGTVMRPVRASDLAAGLADGQAGSEGAEPTPLPPGNLGALMIDEMRAILAGAHAGRMDKARADALLSMIRVAERLDALQPDTGQQEQAKSDDELAEILTRVDRRIVELARDYAERLVAERADAA